MTARKALLSAFLVASAACMVVGFLGAGHWLGACLGALPGLCALALQPGSQEQKPKVSRRPRTRWLPAAFLSCTAAVAAAGLLAGASPWAVLPGIACALAAWDLMNVDVPCRSSPSPAAVRGDRHHIRSLALALGVGLLPAMLGAALSLRIPFPLMLALVVLDLLSLERLLRPGGTQRSSRRRGHQGRW
jgi:hypothetical protein